MASFRFDTVAEFTSPACHRETMPGAFNETAQFGLRPKTRRGLVASDSGAAVATLDAL